MAAKAYCMVHGKNFTCLGTEHYQWQGPWPLWGTLGMKGGPVGKQGSTKPLSGAAHAGRQTLENGV